jgi:flagellar hook-associated protein 3 FlgL
MRVTNSMLTNNFLRNLNNNLNRLEKLQNRLHGKRISAPSDDPVGLVYALRMRANISGLEQYLGNVEDAVAWLKQTDSALESATEILHRAKDLALYGASQTLEKSSLDALAKEVDQLVQEMVQVGNTNFSGRYIFAGNKTDQPPFDAAGVYLGGFKERELEIGVDILIPYSITGDKIFGGAGQSGVQDLHGLLHRLRDALDGSSGESSGDVLGDLDAALDQLLNSRAEVGARVNRLDLVKNRLDESHLNFTELLSQMEDADLAETVIHLKSQENVYRASLAAGARIIQPSLVDFLR